MSKEVKTTGPFCNTKGNKERQIQNEGGKSGGGYGTVFKGATPEMNGKGKYFNSCLNNKKRSNQRKPRDPPRIHK